jgi:hypothetical protein
MDAKARDAPPLSEFKVIYLIPAPVMSPPSAAHLDALRFEDNPAQSKASRPDRSEPTAEKANESSNYIAILNGSNGQANGKESV